MAQTWKYAIGLGLVGAALATGCVVKSGGDGDIGDSGASGEGGTGGTTGGSGGSGGTTGGSSGKGGTTGGSSGKGGAAGAATGGSSGKGGAAGSGAGTGGATGGSAGTGPAAGTGGTGGPTEEDKIPECDPGTGNLDNTPYPDCEPLDPQDPDPCEACIEANCCEESKACYSYAPGNVCGWGGPAEGEDYAGAGEIGCYVQCLADYVMEFDVCDQDGQDECIGKCLTVECGTVLGTQTSELAACIHTSCNQECIGTASCE